MLKPYIDTNTKLKTEAKNNFEKDFFKLMTNSVCGKTMENVRKHRDIRLVTESNYYTRNYFSEDLLGIEMKKIKVKMNKAMHLGLPILDISNPLIYEFWYDYIKPKYEDNATLFYMDLDSFFIHIKTENFYKDIGDHVKKRFDTSNYDVDRPLPKGINKKVIGLMKDKLGGKIII